MISYVTGAQTLRVTIRSDDAAARAEIKAILEAAGHVVEFDEAPTGEHVVDLTGPNGAIRAVDTLASYATLREIIANRAFYPVFQPVVDLAVGRVVGYEALTRFHDGSSPDQRFDEAEQLGLRSRLEAATLDEALSAAASLPAGTWLSVNISPAFLLDGGALRHLVADTDREVVLELTEHDPIDDYATVLRELDRIGGQPCLSIDDAGSGFASLRHVVNLQPRFVKLDQSWVRGVHADPVRQALVSALVQFSRVTGSVLVAEGIELEAERQVLGALGVDLGQGFLLGRPAPAI